MLVPRSALNSKVGSGSPHPSSCLLHPEHHKKRLGLLSFPTLRPHIIDSTSMQTRNHQTAEKMLSFAPSPIFSGSWDHRPAVPSPLSSSPIRASSPLSPIERNAHPQRQIQSSPIQPIKFKFASRPTRPNPVVRKREEAQEGRRKLFLNNVRQKSEDKAWKRRDIEGQVIFQDKHEKIQPLTLDSSSRTPF